MLNHEIIQFKVKGIETDVDVLTRLSDILLVEGIVKETYKEAVVTREKEFSTGLLVNNIGVAIPHTDAEHVNESQMAVMTLEEPVIFKQMGDNSIGVPVSIVFMLALKEAKTHLTMLQTLIELIQNEEVINRLLSFSNTDENKQKLKLILEEHNIL